MANSFLPTSTKQFCNELLDLHKALRLKIANLQKETPKSHLLLLLLFFTLGFALRFNHLFQPIRYDEALTYVYYAAKPISYGLSNYFNPNNHPLNTLCIHLSTALFGNHEWAIRLPSFVVGNLLVLAVYLFGRSTCSSSVGLLACGLTASSSCLIGYSCNGRGYLFVCLFTVLAAIFAKGLQQSVKKPTLARSLPIILCGALGAWSIPTMALPFAGLMLWLLCFRQERKELIFVGLLTTLAVGLLYLPIFLHSGLSALTSNPFVVAQKGDFLSSLKNGAQKLFSLWHRDQPLPFVLLLLISFFFAHKKFQKINIFYFILLTSLAFTFFRRVFPYLRVWSYLLPFYHLTCACGLLALIRKITDRTDGLNTNHTTLAGAPKPPSDVTLITICAFCLPLFFFVFTSTSIEDSEETGLFKSAAQVATIIKESVFKEDRVLAWRPADMPLLYYMLKKRKSAHYLLSDVSASAKVEEQLREMKRGGRLMIVVKKPGQKLADVLAGTNFPKEKFSPLHPLKDIAGAKLYGAICLKTSRPKPADASRR